jgi:hypothetical protein
MRSPKLFDPQKYAKRGNNYGLEISTLIRMIKTGDF